MLCRVFQKRKKNNGGDEVITNNLMQEENSSNANSTSCLNLSMLQCNFLDDFSQEMMMMINSDDQNYDPNGLQYWA